ncbi:MAG: acyl carrier protein [Chloroflexi bacterium]|nr:acyl carrier protein [Chloroflexota bacterium]
MPTSTELQLQQLVAAKLKVGPERVPLDQSLMDDLGLDSFDVMSVILEIEEAFAPATLSDEAAQELKTLREVAAYIDEQLANQTDLTGF